MNDDERDYAEERYNAEILRTGDGELEEVKVPQIWNPNIVLGIVRFARDYPELDSARISLDATSAVNDLLLDASDMVPDADLVYEYLKDLYEQE